MNFTLRPLCAALALSVTTTAGPALAQDATAAGLNESGQQRIEQSGKLRMLSQIIPAAACHLAVAVEPELSVAILDFAAEEFDQILNALENGDPALDIIGPETRRKTIAEVEAVRATWTPLGEAARTLVSGEIAAEPLQALMDGNAELLEQTQILAAEVAGQYVNPAEVVKADSFLIEIAGRQNMLLQEMSKFSCMVSIEYEIETATQELDAAVAAFSTTLVALRDGMPSAGIRPAPTAEIKEGLTAAADIWAQVKPLLETLIAGEVLTEDQIAQKYMLLNETNAVMNGVVQMYVDATES